MFPLWLPGLPPLVMLWLVSCSAPPEWVTVLTYFLGSPPSSRFPDSERHSPFLALSLCGQIPGNSLILALPGEISPSCSPLSSLHVSLFSCAHPCQPWWGLLQAGMIYFLQLPNSSLFFQFQVRLLFSNNLAYFKCISSYPEDTYECLSLFEIK